MPETYKIQVEVSDEAVKFFDTNYQGLMLMIDEASTPKSLAAAAKLVTQTRDEYNAGAMALAVVAQQQLTNFGKSPLTEDDAALLAQWKAAYLVRQRAETQLSLRMVRYHAERAAGTLLSDG